MSSDVGQVVMLGQHVNFLWSCPLQVSSILEGNFQQLMMLHCAELTLSKAEKSMIKVCVATVAMYQVLGWPALVGVASLFLATPVTLVLAKLISDLMATQMKVKDERLRVLSEIISGMRVVKLFAWEGPFTERILERREEETKVLRKKGALGSGFSFLWNMIPFMVGFVAFACHAGICSAK